MDRIEGNMAYKRKTRDLWDVEGYYAGGWEAVTCEESRSEAKARLKEYRENDPGTSYRLRKYREKIEANL